MPLICAVCACVWDIFIKVLSKQIIDVSGIPVVRNVHLPIYYYRAKVNFDVVAIVQPI